MNAPLTSASLAKKSVVAAVAMVCIGVGVCLPSHNAMAFFFADQPSNTAAAPPDNTKASADFWLMPGLSIRQNLMEWARRSGWTIIWRLDSDLPTPVKLDMGPDFVQAVIKTINYLSTTVHIKATGHDVDKVIVVEAS